MASDITYMLRQLKDSLEGAKPKVSFEFFPPKTPQADAALKEVIHRLEKLGPRYVSVTYGAGGSTREHTRDLVAYIKASTVVPPAAHLTCVNATKEEIDTIAKGYLEIGVNRIVALRGDPPGMQGSYMPHPEGYAYAHELVQGLKALGDFDISVAAFPEVHPEAVSPEADLDYLKEKMDAGADRAITQYCFDTDSILRFIDKARARGITKPIVPGIIAIGNFAQVVSFSKRCGATVPSWLVTLFEGTENNPVAHEAVAVAVAAEQCRLLMQEGISEFHFYTLNQAPISIAICQLLGVKASVVSA